MKQFGTLKRLDLREVWKHEASDFTPWLADNINILGEALGMDLELEDQEVPRGSFSLDILARDASSGDRVVIENQIEQTDHKHLGQLLTYASGSDETSAIVVWIAESIRKEHRETLEWLNKRTDSDTLFFGVIVEAIQIDDSNPACSFRPIVLPVEWPRDKKRQSTKTILVNGERYQKFFQSLIDDLRENHQFTNAEDVGETNLWEFLSGAKGFRFCAAFYQHEGGRPCIEAYIDLRSKAQNKMLFDSLHAQKESIETSLGAELKWERQDKKVTSRIRLYRDGSIEASDEELKIIHDWMVKSLLAFKVVFFPRVDKWQKENTLSTDKKVSDGKRKCQDFFQLLIDDLRENHQFTSARRAQMQSWYNFSFGFSRTYLVASFIGSGRASVEVYIDSGGAEENKAIFDALQQQKDTIEAELGAELEWKRLDERRASRIMFCRDGSIESPAEELKEIHDWMVKNLLAFKQVFSPRIKAVLG